MYGKSKLVFGDGLIGCLGLRSRGKFHTGIWNSGTSSGCMAQLPEPRSEKQKLPKNHRDSDGREGHARAWQGIRMDL